MQLKSGNFMFAGATSDRYFLEVTSVDIEESNTRLFGLNRSATYNNGYMTAQEDKVELEFTFRFIKNREGFKPNQQLQDEVARWLFRDEPQYLSSAYGGLLYYVIFTSAEYVTEDGYFKCKATSMPYALTSTLLTNVTITNVAKTIEVGCNDITKEVYPVISILSLADQTLRIQSNKGFNNFIEIDLKANEEVDIDCDNKEIISNKEDIYSRVRMDNDYLKLIYGSNSLTFTSTSNTRTRIQIAFQEKRALGIR